MNDRIYTKEAFDNAINNLTGISGSGDVFGPTHTIVRFDGTTGKLVQNSTCTIDDNGNLQNQLKKQKRKLRENKLKRIFYESCTNNGTNN